MKNIVFALLLIAMFGCKQSPKENDTITTETTDTVVSTQVTTPPAGIVTKPGRVMTEVEALEVLKHEKIDGKIIAMWHAEEGLGATLFLYEDRNKELRMRTAFNDGINMDNKITASTQDGKTRYDDDIGKGEYYLIEANGNLGLYGEEGKFDEAIKVVKGQ